jgi:hypothetical protein
MTGSVPAIASHRFTFPGHPGRMAEIGQAI